MAEQALGDGAVATAKMPTSVSQVQPLPVGAAVPAVTTDTAEVMMPQQPGKVSSGSAAAPDERKKKKDKDVGGGEGEGGHVYPVKQPLDLKHERCAGVVSKYSPSNGWGSVRSHMFEGEITFRTDRIMLEFQGHPLTEGETVEFDIQADENDHGRPHAVMLKPMIGRKGRDCIGQRHRGYVRRFAERWGFLNAAAFDGDLFVHRDNLLAVPDDGSGQPALRPGQAVEFDVAQDDRGRCVAKQITTHALLRPCDWINHRLRGYIRSFQGAWGFINSDRFAGDLFVHRDSLLAQCAQANLGVGTVVEFDIERDHHRKGAKNRLVARNVAVLPGEAAILGHGQAPIPGQAQQLGGYMPGVDPAAAVYAAGAATTAASTPTAGMNPLANTFTPSQTMPMLYPQVGGPTDPYAAAAQLTASAYGAAPYPYAQSPYGLPGMPGGPQPQPGTPQQPLPSPYGQLGQQAYAPTAPYPYGTLPPYGMPPQPGQPQPGLQVPPPLPQQPQPGMPSMPGLPPGGYGLSGSGMDLGSAAAAARDALEKAKRAAMFQRQIQEQMAKLKNQGLAAGFLPGEGPKARKLILDEFGRELDEDGNVVPMKPQTVSTLKVNINREKEARLKKILGLKTEDGGEANYFDNTLKISRSAGGERPKRKTFRFFEEGALVRKEARIVKKIQEKALGIDKEKEAKGKQKELEKEKHKQAQEDKKDEAEIGMRRIEPKILRREPIPDVEWWDVAFLDPVEEVGQKRTYGAVNVEKITPYIEHPVPIKITTEKDVPEAPMMHLTPKERRKLRRLKRQERTQEIRDKIKMGILQPPPPKVKMSNLMRVLGDEAIADPSTVERKVRAQVEQRRKEHEQRNEARKLPAEERKAKKMQKWKAELEPTTQVLVFKIKDLSNKRHLFKIDMNAQQFHLTGCCISCPGVANIVVIEGGPRAIKRYRKLMMRRIKWSEDAGRDDDSDESDDDNVTAPKIQDYCVLIWEGVVKNRNFKNWKVTHARSEQEARKTLTDRGAEHYWEMLARHRDPRIDI